MSKLVRNTTPHGDCKYGLIRLDKIRLMQPAQREAIIRILENLRASGVYEGAGKNDVEEVFCIKLKDSLAFPALVAYATACVDYDPELALDVFELATRARRRQDARSPTV